MLDQIGAAIGVNFINKLFARSKKQEINIISAGLAIGYFYNFLDLISSAFKPDQLEIHSSAQGSGAEQSRATEKFNSRRSRVEIIIPARLSAEAFDRCNSEFKEVSKKGFLHIPDQGRDYAINYFVSASGDAVTVVDLARPLMMVKRYYEEIVKMDTHDDSNGNWNKVQAAEIAAFKECLRQLQKRGHGALLNQLDFRERS